MIQLSFVFYVALFANYFTCFCQEEGYLVLTVKGLRALPLPLDPALPPDLGFLSWMTSYWRVNLVKMFVLLSRMNKIASNLHY